MRSVCESTISNSFKSIGTRCELYLVSLIKCGGNQGLNLFSVTLYLLLQYFTFTI